MNLAQGLALFLSFYASRERAGINISYPDRQLAFSALFTSVSQTTLARFQILASLHPDFKNGEAINIGGEDEGVSWEKLWPDLTSHFGLVGVGPDESFSISGYMQEHQGDDHRYGDF